MGEQVIGVEARDKKWAEDWIRRINSIRALRANPLAGGVVHRRGSRSRHRLARDPFRDHFSFSICCSERRLVSHPHMAPRPAPTPMRRWHGRTACERARMPPRPPSAAEKAVLRSSIPSWGVSVRRRSIELRQPLIEPALDFPLDDHPAPVAAPCSSSEVAPRALDRPPGLSDTLDRMFEMSPQKTQDLAVEIAPVRHFKVEQLVRNAPLRLQGGGQKKSEPTLVEPVHRLCRVSSHLHGPI